MIRANCQFPRISTCHGDQFHAGMQHEMAMLAFRRFADWTVLSPARFFLSVISTFRHAFISTLTRKLTPKNALLHLVFYRNKKAFHWLY